MTGASFIATAAKVIGAYDAVYGSAGDGPLETSIKAAYADPGFDAHVGLSSPNSVRWSMGCGERRLRA